MRISAIVCGCILFTGCVTTKPPVDHDCDKVASFSRGVAIMRAQQR